MTPAAIIPNADDLPRGRAFSARWAEIEWLAVLTLALGTAALGWLGFRLHGRAHGLQLAFLDELYLSLQLFTMNSGAVAVPVPLPLEVARFFAPLVAVYTAVKAVLAVFREQVDGLRLRFTHDHDIVCGLGRKGLRLTRDLLAQGRRVVAIDTNDGNDSVTACREAGAIVLFGNAADPYLLSKAGVSRAKHVFATCGEDGLNVEIGLHVARLNSARNGHDGRPSWERSAPSPWAPRQGSGPSCLVHVGDGRLREMLSRHQERNSESALRFFNTYQDSARALLESYPPEGDTAGTSGAHADILVVGFGRKGEGIAIQTARIAHYASGIKPRITVLDRRASSKAKFFLHTWPQLPDVCDLEFHDVDIEGPEFLDGGLLHNGGTERTYGSVYVCLGTDPKTFSCCLVLDRLLADSSVPVVGCLVDEHGFANLLPRARGEGGDAARVRVFGVISNQCRSDVLLEESRDCLARAVHEDYVKARRAETKPPAPDDPALAAWERLPEELRSSNRQQADHIAVKLREVRCVAVPMDGRALAPFAFTPEEVERLARAEHARWIAERRLAGWLPGPRDVAARRSPFLIPWDDLPDEVRDYDLRSVRKIPALLQLIGQQVQRIQPAWSAVHLPSL
ncbi:MAG: NAD-binding protein [Candidatus Riflebacteria bacterium]|nr:NAD-binding protein [Candidatus Riflebacteria bacterium]